MTLKIGQDYEYIGNDTWKWWVWIDGEESELDQIEAVEYHLHPTFPRPVRQVKDRSDGFRLVAQGWGVFEIKALLKRADGSFDQLSHMLELAYPPGSDEAVVAEKAAVRGPDQESRPSVFIAVGTADQVAASDLRTSLAAKGVEVWSDEPLSSGAPWDVAVEQAIEDADAVVALSSDVPSKWVEREVNVANKHGIRVISVALTENAQLPESTEASEAIRVSELGDFDEVAASIVTAIDA